MLSSFTGTVPGEAVAEVIPSAVAERDLRRDLHRHRRRRARQGRADRAVLPEGRRRHLHRSPSTTTARSRPSPPRDRASRRAAAARLAAVAVAFAAADTYVVVLALPDMMGSRRPRRRRAPAGGADRVRLPARLRRDAAADRPDRRPPGPAPGPGRLARRVRPRLAGHRRGLRPARAWSPAGSSRASAAAAWCPATLALVADLYPPHRRGVPLGVVGAVQELGSVLGPLYGALVLAVADWQAIFAINLAVGLVLAVALRSLADPSPVQQDAGVSPQK